MCPCDYLTWDNPGLISLLKDAMPSLQHSTWLEVQDTTLYRISLSFTAVWGVTQQHLISLTHQSLSLNVFTQSFLLKLNGDTAGPSPQSWMWMERMRSIIFGFHAYFCYFSQLALHWKYDVLPAYLVDCTKLIGHITKFSLSSDPGKNDDSALIVNAFISLVENKHKYTHKFIDFCEWLRLLLHDSFDGKVHPTCVSLCISATYARASQVALVVKKKKKKKTCLAMQET